MFKLNSIANVKEDAAKKQYLGVKFVNKLIDQIKLKEIITSNRSINVLMNHNINGFRVPSISYQYSNTIRSDVLNYKQTIVEEESYPETCNCTDYDNTFIDGLHKHVFTGNLAIAGNKTLKDLLSKGLNFR